MTPKEKAEELLDKYIVVSPMYFEQVKQCALIAVDEILHELIYKNPSASAIERIEYWQKVKNEIKRIRY
jgi:hypothetical protein